METLYRDDSNLEITLVASFLGSGINGNDYSTSPPIR